ncbi:sorting nexin-2-like isoform X2 [Babylonia areolata]|uniref:sorting nexin-2-like isoform X2 n=1 Tax=Babylonia areolata TaxID=304850 RepID=UPI003FD5E50B
MADGMEPPPFEDEQEQKEDDDLFSDAKEKPSSPETDASTASIPISGGGGGDKNDDAADDKKDLFDDAAGSEIKLDSDEEGDSPATSATTTEERKNSGEYSSPFDAPSAAPAAAAIGVAAASAASKDETPQISVSQMSTSSVSKVSSTSKSSREEMENGEEEDQFDINITVTEPQKMGDGMSAYMVYRVVTKTTNPMFRKSEMNVPRRFSDFLGLHAKLAEKHTPLGIVVPPAPEKSVLGMTKIKMSKEESGSAEFVERRRAALERYLNRTASHPVLLADEHFKEFVEKDSELPRATSTSALSGAGIMRLVHKVGGSFEKMAFKMDENDEWFEEKQQQIEALDQQLHKLHTSVEALVSHRRELSMSTGVFAKSAAMLGNMEEHTTLSRALSQLAETEEKIETIQKGQADTDFYVMAELLKDYIAFIGSVKEVFHERVKSYKNWKEAEVMLGKKREAKAKFEVLNNADKVALAKQEITEWEGKVEKGQQEFEKLSKVIRREVTRFEAYRVEDFKKSVIKYLQTLMENQQKLIKYWESFLLEAKAIA